MKLWLVSLLFLAAIVYSQGCDDDNNDNGQTEATTVITTVPASDGDNDNEDGAGQTEATTVIITPECDDDNNDNEGTDQTEATTVITSATTRPTTTADPFIQSLKNKLELKKWLQEQKLRSGSYSQSTSIEFSGPTCHGRFHRGTSVSETGSEGSRRISASVTASLSISGGVGKNHWSRTLSASASMTYAVDEKRKETQYSQSVSRSMSASGGYGSNHWSESASTSESLSIITKNGKTTALRYSSSASASRNEANGQKHQSMSTSTSILITKGSQSGEGGGEGGQSGEGTCGGTETKYVYPKCCNPCDLLKNPESDYYQNCGRFLPEAELEKNFKLCKACKKYNRDMECFLGKLKRQCYKEFVAIVRFDCLPVAVTKTTLGGYGQEMVQKLEQACSADDYCPPPEPKCDKCEALLDTNSQFYRVCGHAVDEGLRQLWYMKCRYSPGQCHWKVIESMIIGYCHCISTCAIPEFCPSGKPSVPPPPPPPPTTANPNCAYDDGELIFGSINTLIQGCKKMCNCTSPGVLECKDVNCDSDATCDTDEDGNENCVCNSPFTGNGFECFPPPLPVCVGQKMDIIFLVDTSASISSTQFAEVKNFIAQFIVKLDVGPDETHVGIIRFSQKATVEATLGSYNDKASLVTISEHIVHDQLLTYTHLPIGVADEMFTTNGRMNNTKQVMVILTDGKSTDPVKTIMAMKDFRQHHPNATVMVVAVMSSGDVDQAEIRMLASGLEEQNVYRVKDFDALLDEFTRLAKETCEGYEPKFKEGPCDEILYYSPGELTRWYNHYGVYDKVYGQELCNDEYLYVHGSERSFLQWNGTNWVISQKPCVFNSHVQTLAKLIYGSTVTPEDHHVISEDDDEWEEPGDEPTYFQTKTVCF